MKKQPKTKKVVASKLTAEKKRQLAAQKKAIAKTNKVSAKNAKVIGDLNTTIDKIAAKAKVKKVREAPTDPKKMNRKQLLEHHQFAAEIWDTQQKALIKHNGELASDLNKLGIKHSRLIGHTALGVIVAIVAFAIIAYVRFH